MCGVFVVCVSGVCVVVLVSCVCGVGVRGVCVCGVLCVCVCLSICLFRNYELSRNEKFQRVSLGDAYLIIMLPQILLRPIL